MDEAGAGADDTAAGAGAPARTLDWRWRPVPVACHWPLPGSWPFLRLRQRTACHQRVDAQPRWPALPAAGWLKVFATVEATPPRHTVRLTLLNAFGALAGRLDNARDRRWRVMGSRIMPSNKYSVITTTVVMVMFAGCGGGEGS